MALAVGILLRRLVPNTRAPEGPSTRAMGLWGWASVATIILAGIAATLSAASSAATSADLLLIWGPKAEHFALKGMIDPAFLGDPMLDYLHTSYPPLVTNLFALATSIAGRFPWGAATLTYPLLLVACGAGLPGALGSSRRGYGLAALVVGIVACAGTPIQIAGNGDMPLIFFEVMATALLIRPDAQRPEAELLAGLLIAGAVLSKVEGMPFALVAVAGATVVSQRHRWRSALRLGLPSAIALGTWFGFGAVNNLFWGYRGYGRFAEVHWYRTPKVIPSIFLALKSVCFGLPFAIPLVLVVLIRPATRGWIPAITALLLGGFIVFTYLHGDIDPTEWIGWSAARVMLPCAVLLMLSTFSQGARPPTSRDSARGPVR